MNIINLKSSIPSNFQMVFNTEEDKKYLQSLVEFVFLQFEEMFGKELLQGEDCLIYNNPNNHVPFLKYGNPLEIISCCSDLRYWAQFIYHLSHELTHYVLRKLRTDKNKVPKWIEETICEAISLHTLRQSSDRWDECILYDLNPDYDLDIYKYFEEEFSKTGESELQTCRTFQQLQLIENTSESNRLARSLDRNYLVESFDDFPESIKDLVFYPIFMRSDLTIDFKLWRQVYPNSALIPILEYIHPQIA